MLIKFTHQITEVSSLNLQKNEALLLINSLRNGVALQKKNHLISVGRNEEVFEFKRCFDLLDSGASTVKFITGDYGSGKTFLYNQIKNMAIENNYVVSSFQLNQSFRLNKIEDMFYAIMHNLYIKNSPHGKTSFSEIFDLWIDKIQSSDNSDEKSLEINFVCSQLAKYNYSYARGFLTFMRGRINNNSEMINVSSSWLSGEANIPYESKQKYGLIGSADRTTSMDFIKAFTQLISLLDYNGLVIFIDELDLVMNDRADIRSTAYNNLKLLLDLTSSGELSKLMFVFTGTHQLFTDEIKGITSAKALSQRLGHNHSFDQPYPIRGPIMKLNTISDREYLGLTSKIYDLYSVAYYINTANTLDDLVKLTISLHKDSPVTTRSFIISLISILDDIHQYKDESKFEA